MVNIMPRQVLTPHPRLLVAFTGLEGDIQSLKRELTTTVESTTLPRVCTTGSTMSSSPQRPDQPKEISATAMSSLTSHILYRRRTSPYYVEPIVVGLEKEWNAKDRQVEHRPFLCGYDLIGAQSTSRAFVCAGVASQSLYGAAEAAWRPGLSPEELARVCGKAFLSALERDSLSGYGAVVYLITKDKLVEIELACRND